MSLRLPALLWSARRAWRWLAWCSLGVLPAWMAVAADTDLFGQARTIGRAWFRGGDGPLSTGWPVDAAQTCAACHADIAREWRESLHADSWTDPFFQLAYAREPEPFCRHCHAPLAIGRPSGPAAEDGISCVACHVRDGRIHGTRARAADASGHAVVAAPELASAGWCGGCHQFGFYALPERPGVARFETSDAQQDTYAEWTRSPHAAAGRTCQACHMPLVRDAAGRWYRSHRFAGTTSELLRSAIEIHGEATARDGGVDVTFRLRASGAGHAYPTGDLFRRAVLRVWREDRPGDVVRVLLARRYGSTHGRDAARGAWVAKRAVLDDRVPPSGDRTVHVRLTGAGRGPVRWSLDDDKMPTPDPRLSGRDLPLRTIRVAEGRLDVREVPQEFR